ncbi:MAG: hypothetical protein HY270_04255 [Deltaproteobacteria bacterium]|nr:hypothetical protein [Deltaproteobacteria bacterium]
MLGRLRIEPYHPGPTLFTVSMERATLPPSGAATVILIAWDLARLLGLHPVTTN